MAARPLLQLIAHLLSVRQKAGGSVLWHDVKAHTKNSDIDSVGNRLADWQATRARSRPGEPQPLQLRELPVADCEHYLAVHHELPAGRRRLLIDDIRRAAVAVLKAAALIKWSSRRDPSSRVMCDGALADSALLDLCKVVLAIGSTEQQNALVRIATNSLQCEWATDAATNTQRVEPLACSDCADSVTSCSLGHLAECAGPQATLFRADLRRDILAVLHSAPQADSWCHQFGMLDLRSMLPAPLQHRFSAPADEQHKHFYNCSFALKRVHCHANLAAKALGFPSADDGRSTLQRIRLLASTE
jgi:hypothetical protein